MTALDVVMQRTAFTQVDADRVALGMFGRLADRFRHFTGLARTVADAALLVADNDQRGKAETPTALHHLGNAVDADQLVRSGEHTSELQSIMRHSYAVFCLKKKK